MDYKIEYHTEPELFLLKKIVDRINHTIDIQGFVTIALSGGHTPGKLCRMLGQSDVPFKQIHFFQVDERYVADDHNDSNIFMLQNTLFNNGDISQKNVHSINTNYSYEQAIKSYQQQVEDFLHKRGKAGFDIIILGLGGDGHTASVFSENSDDFLTWETVIGSKSFIYPHKRISLSLGFINKGNNIYFLVKGKNKITALKRLIEGDRDIAASLICKKAVIYTDLDITE